MTLREEIERLGGVNRLANVSEAEHILRSQGDREVKPYLATGTGAGDLFVIVGGGHAVMGFEIQPSRTTKLHFYIVIAPIDKALPGRSCLRLVESI